MSYKQLLVLACVPLSGWSADLLGGACAAGSACTTVTSLSWTKLPAAGWPAGIVGYEKAAYSPTLDCTAFIGVYHEGQGEPNQAINCFSYTEQRWTILHDWGTWQDSYQWVSGHPVGVFAWLPIVNSFWLIGGNSGSNMPERTNHTYLVGGPGQATQDRYTGASPNILPVIGSNVFATSAYDSYNDKVVIYPNISSTVSTYDRTANLYSQPSTTGPAHPGTGFPASDYNSLNHKVYLYGGIVSGPSNCAGTASTAITTFDAASSTWATVSQTPDPVNGAPSARVWAGWAFSPADNLFLMSGGCDGSHNSLQDTWAFHLSTGTWELLNTTAPYFISSDTVDTPFERMTYDSANNAFVMFMQGNQSTDYTGGTATQYTTGTWAYCYSTCSVAGRAALSYSPTPGYINTRYTGTGTQPNAQIEEGAVMNTSLGVDIGTGTVYAAWIESGKSFDTAGDERLRHPYAQKTLDGSAWTTMGAYSALDTASTESDNSHIAVVNGTPWLVWSNGAANPMNPQLQTASWNGSTWNSPVSISPVGGAGHYRGISAITAVGATPTIASIEAYSAGRTAEVYVNQWNGSSWTQLGGSLTVNSGGRPLFVDVASDGANPYVCHTEEIASVSYSVVTLTPQLYCHYYNGAAWVQIGSSLNRSATSWTADVAVTYFAGHLYVACTERTTAGNPKLYVYSCTTSACALIGNAINKDTTNGWSVHPSLANDGTTLYLTWEEQLNGAEKQELFAQLWNGSTWSQMGGSLNVDTANGSAAYNSLAVAAGKPAVLWSEVTPGNLRQAYIRQWDGSNWGSLSGSVSAAMGGSSIGGNGKAGGVVVH
jgi:hypothetical protein